MFTCGLLYLASVLILFTVVEMHRNLSVLEWQKLSNHQHKQNHHITLLHMMDICTSNFCHDKFEVSLTLYIRAVSSTVCLFLNGCSWTVICSNFVLWWNVLTTKYNITFMAQLWALLSHFKSSLPTIWPSLEPDYNLLNDVWHLIYKLDWTQLDSSQLVW